MISDPVWSVEAASASTSTGNNPPADQVDHTPIAAPGRCAGCNFDLSGAPSESVRRTRTRCPECGQVAERDAEPA